MPENQAAGSITQDQYNRYTADWTKLLKEGSAETLRQAFQAPGVERINFLNFSIDQVSALVAAPGVALIKARFLAIPDADNMLRFTTALFGLDANGELVTAYYTPFEPSLAAPAPTHPAEPTAEAGTQIPRKLAWQWLTDWVDVPALSLALFDTPGGLLRGYNFEVSTFENPLAAAQPTDGKGLFLNLGLHQAADSPEIPQTLDLVVYINLLGSRAQGTLAGLPDDESFYNSGVPCPPSPMMS